MAHLKADEFVDALDAVLAPERQRHLDGCERCRVELDRMQAAWVEAGAGREVPAPSPLFWPRLSDRVRVAVNRPGMAPARGWFGWRAPTAALTVAVAALLVMVVRMGPTTPVSTVAEGPAPADPSLMLVADLAAAIPYEDLEAMARPTAEATDALVAQLTPDQRLALVRLLEADAGSAE
jgi:hypothetical protein